MRQSIENSIISVTYRLLSTLQAREAPKRAPLLS